MTALVPLFRAPLVVALVLAATASPDGVASRQVSDDDLLCRFAANVDGYVRLHRRLEAFVPPQVYTSDPELLFMSRNAMALAIRQERSTAKQGDIFSADIAALFRRVVNQTLRDDGVVWELFLSDDGMTLPIEVRVNGDYPAGGPVATMSPTLLKALPPLPPELQYRFVNATLVLWDVHAALIVDFVPDVFRMTTDPADE